MPTSPIGNSLFEVESGLLFKDDFQSLNSRWTASPVGSYSLTDNPSHIRLKHHVSQDTLILANIPSDIFAFEVIADYNPTVPGDEGGILIWNNSTEKIEFLESYDKDKEESQKNWMVVKEGNDWRFFSDEGLGYNFVDSDVMEATKFGVVLKRGSNTDFVDLDVDRIIATKGNKLTVMNVIMGGIVQLLDKDGNIMAEDYVQDGSAIQLQMPYLEIEGTLNVLDAERSVICTVDGVFHGGDIYNVGAELQVRIDETELSRTEQTNLGNMVSGKLEVLMNVHNPSNLSATNVQIGVIQYDNKFGYQWANVALDSSGTPLDYSDTITIPVLKPNETVYFWVKVTKGTDYVGLDSLQFNIIIKQD